MLVSVPLGTLAAYGLLVSRSPWARAVRAVLLTPICGGAGRLDRFREE
jgi:ABC-type spermidine/putrescine transport system permease subunit II